MDAPWIAVTVERPGAYVDGSTRRRLDDIMKLAESLGAETQTLAGQIYPPNSFVLPDLRMSHRSWWVVQEAVLLANCCAGRYRTNWFGERKILRFISSRVRLMAR
jgi:hypothetical protein